MASNRHDGTLARGRFSFTESIFSRFSTATPELRARVNWLEAAVIGTHVQVEVGVEMIPEFWDLLKHQKVPNHQWTPKICDSV
jgi:hypothetical protein